ncbi:uncharacterized protein LOC118421613 [Branchiostoma floridae]|uniref:Uncharacterized protein LOC118421613 n=1 Tax=Branchiostoma floridae TaxID=7739 RepID=C3Z4V2_BRAFL|nr:uncharacterized protein LOC118421613 [Branchiostoma floridae]|eukprot:XP_002596297.1 hypothetical protein BRAFLDRAFT_82100 [Branchiostoma floridae]
MMFGKTWVFTVVVMVLLATSGTEGFRIRNPKSKNTPQKSTVTKDRPTQQKSATAITKDLPINGQNYREMEELKARVGSLERTVGSMSRTMGQIGLKMKETEISRDRLDPDDVRQMRERLETMIHRVDNLDEWRSRQGGEESSNANAGGQSNDNEEQPEGPVIPRPMPGLFPGGEEDDQEQGAGGTSEGSDQSQEGDLTEDGDGGNTGDGRLPLFPNVGIPGPNPGPPSPPGDFNEGDDGDNTGVSFQNGRLPIFPPNFGHGGDLPNIMPQVFPPIYDSEHPPNPEPQILPIPGPQHVPNPDGPEILPPLRGPVFGPNPGPAGASDGGDDSEEVGGIIPSGFSEMLDRFRGMGLAPPQWQPVYTEEEEEPQEEEEEAIAPLEPSIQMGRSMPGGFNFPG